MESDNLLNKTKEELLEEVYRWKARVEGMRDAITGKGKKYYTKFDLQPLFQSMNAINTAVYVADMETYEILATNEYLENIWGKDILGKKCYEVLQVKQNVPCPFCTNNKLLNDKGESNPPYTWTFQNTRTKSYFQCIDFAIPWENGKLVRVEVALNIDRFVRLQGERIAQMELIKTIIGNIPQATFWKDKNGVILGCNQQFALDANCSSPEEIIGKTDFELLWDKEKSNGFREIDRRVMETGMPCLNYAETVRFSGGEKHLLISKMPLRDTEGNIIGVLGTYIDITDIKKNQDILAHNEQLLNGLMQTVPFGVIFVRDRVIEWCNDRICQAFGYAREEIVGNLTRMFYETDKEFDRVGRDLYGGLTGYKTNWIETRWKTKSGEYIDVRISATLRNPDRMEDGIVAGIIDIREQKQLAQEQEQIRERMYQIQRIQSLEALAGGVAHDFNNILMAMIGSAELANHELPIMSPAREYLNNIITAGKKGAELSQQMLSYARKKSFAKRNVNINSIIEEMIQILKSSISKKVVLKLDLSKELPFIEGDATQLSQVIMNLVINANEAIGDKSGIITVRTSALFCDSKYLDTVFLPDELKEGLYMILEVGDTGCGMDEETKRHIFEPFYTTKFTGRGLGLASVFGIVRGHQGGIKVYSEKGRGTAFKVFLPALEWMEEKETAFTINEKDFDITGTILLAEDEDTIRTLTQRMLEHVGLKVLTSVDGKEAVELFKAHQDEICCVILDLTMPHLSGVEACQAIKKIKASVPIILTSGYSEDQVDMKIGPESFSGYIQKPYRFENLKSIVKNVLSKNF